MNRSTRLKQQPNMGKIVSAQLLSRLPNALREINRRIFVQNIMWLELQTELRKRSLRANLRINP